MLEVNPQHPLLKRIEGEPDAARAGDLALWLLEQAQVAAGVTPDDPSGLVRRMNRLLLETPAA